MDRALVVRAQQGDHDAFERLAAEVAPGLDVVARLITRDPDRAKDAVQDTLFAPGGICPRCAIQNASKRGSGACSSTPARTCFAGCVAGRSRSNYTTSTEVIRMSRRALRTVPPSNMRFGRSTPTCEWSSCYDYYLGLTLPEVADSVGIPVGTTKSRLNRALRELRRTLAPPALGRINAEGEAVR